MRYIQVTIDGVKEKHNARRTTRERADTYSVILHNINSALSMNFEIVIRINVDKSNYATLLELINDICNSINILVNIFFCLLDECLDLMIVIRCRNMRKN